MNEQESVAWHDDQCGNNYPCPLHPLESANARIIELQGMDTKDAQENASLRASLQAAEGTVERMREWIVDFRKALASHSCAYDPRQDGEVNWVELLMRHGANGKRLLTHPAPASPEKPFDFDGCRHEDGVCAKIGFPAHLPPANPEPGAKSAEKCGPHLGESCPCRTCHGMKRISTAAVKFPETYRDCPECAPPTPPDQAKEKK